MTMPVRILLPHTVETLQKLNFEVSAHPPYSPDLAPFRLSPVWSTQGDVKGPSIHLGPRTEGNGASVARCSAKNIFFFPEGIKMLVQRWKKCIEEQGDYVEK